MERETLEARAQHGVASSNHGNAELVANILRTIESKRLKADPAMILILDTNDAPAYTDDPNLLDIVRGKLRLRGLLNDWREIWLLGPTGPRTSRVDI